LEKPTWGNSPFYLPRLKILIDAPGLSYYKKVRMEILASQSFDEVKEMLLDL